MRFLSSDFATDGAGTVEHLRKFGREGKDAGDPRRKNDLECVAVQL
jgi:hypothetical protein